MVEETHARDFTLRWIQHKPATTEDRGPDATKARINRLRKAFPDFHLTTDTMVADGDMVAVRWTITGTHRGDFVIALGTFPPTGNYVKTEGISIFRLSRGKIVEEWISYDRLGLLQ